MLAYPSPMLQTTQLYLKKNAPLFGLIGGAGGFFGDVLAPLANFSFYLLVASLIGVGIMAGIYYISHRDNKVTKKEAALTRLAFFGIFTLIWGFFSFVHVVGPSNGVMAASIPGIEKLQESIGILEAGVVELQETTSEIKGDTEMILLELQDLRGELEAAQSGSITSHPDSPEAWYTNAILYASQGDDDEAVEAYEEFFAYGYPYIDAYQNFNLLAKNALSKNDLKDFYEELAASQPNNVVAQLMVGALIKDADDRRAYYNGVRTLHGDSSVLLYWMMYEYSVVGTYIYGNELDADEKQQWNTGDQSELKEMTDAYGDLPITDNLEVYFINSFSYDGAKTLIKEFENQFQNETVNAMLDNPLIIVTNPTGDPGEFSITFVIYDAYTDILYRIPGVVDEFTSTIPTEVDDNSPWATGTPYPETDVTVAMGPGDYNMEVYWLNSNGKESAVYAFSDVAFLSFSDWSKLTDKPVWVYPDGS